ncbi:MAG: hypothetical protein QNJ63_24895 [Calothrix sp. MO_192.B10]|nr:hypothetical protein [Calothrix sp. MO_192.B10]
MFGRYLAVFSALELEIIVEQIGFNLHQDIKTLKNVRANNDILIFVEIIFTPYAPVNLLV